MSESLKKQIDELVWKYGYDGINAIAVYQENEVIAECYYNGTSDETMHPIYEIWYSILSLMTGIAIDKHIVKSIEVPISNVLPPFSTQMHTLYHRIKVKHLLTMSSGIEAYNRLLNQYHTDYNSREHFLEEVVSLPLTYVPGMHYCKKELDPIILCMFLERLLDYPLSTFLYENILVPLDISYIPWNNTSYGFGYYGSTQKNSPETMVRAADLLKIGELILNKGKYNGKKVISNGYLKEMVRPSDVNNRFGYLWEITPYSYSAYGQGGQQLTILPKEQAAVVILGTRGEITRSYNGLIPSIRNYLKLNKNIIDI